MVLPGLPSTPDELGGPPSSPRVSLIATRPERARQSRCLHVCPLNAPPSIVGLYKVLRRVCALSHYHRLSTSSQGVTLRVPLAQVGRSRGSSVSPPPVTEQDLRPQYCRGAFPAASDDGAMTERERMRLLEPRGALEELVQKRRAVDVEGHLSQVFSPPHSRTVPHTTPPANTPRSSSL